VAVILVLPPPGSVNTLRLPLVNVYYVLGYNHALWYISRDNLCLRNIFLPGTVTTTIIYKLMVNLLELVGSTHIGKLHHFILGCSILYTGALYENPRGWLLSLILYHLNYYFVINSFMAFQLYMVFVSITLIFLPHMHGIIYITLASYYLVFTIKCISKYILQ